VANAVAMMDGTELNGNRLLGRWWRDVFRTNGWLLFKVIFCYFPTWKSTAWGIYREYGGICSLYVLPFGGSANPAETDGFGRSAKLLRSQCRNLKSSQKLW
jgi:hypothetical protein